MGTAQARGWCRISLSRYLGLAVAGGLDSFPELSALLEHKLAESSKMLQCIKVTLLASLNGYAPQVAVEFGRKVLYSTERPSFTELEDTVKQRKARPPPAA